jgi:aspartyl/asparaginyl beta-hydroxylase (cupin superfamily)
VGSEARGWTEGKGLVFDDSFEHEVWHEGAETRIVLLVRFWHPELTREEIESVGALHEIVIDAAGGNESDQRKALESLRAARA